MIYNLSGRTDIIAFYYPWFKKRLQAGFVDVRHPFDERKIFRYSLRKEDVDVLVICTKNPLPILEDPKPLKDYCVLLQVTLTPYGKDLEPFVPPKKQTIQAVKELSEFFGKDHLFIRYDPIVITEKYTISQHIASFEHLVKMLKDDVYVFIISFVDEYKNTQKNGIRALSYQEIRELGKQFGEIAQRYGVKVQTCAETIDLDDFGIEHGLCIDPKHLTHLTGQSIEWVSEKSKRENCSCADYRDIGAYNSCMHFCRYCYANYDESMILNNYKQHLTDSSLLIGELKEEDRVIEMALKPKQMRLF